MRRSGKRSTRSTRNPRNDGPRATTVTIWGFALGLHRGLVRTAFEEREKIIRPMEAKSSHSIPLCIHRRASSLSSITLRSPLQILSPVVWFLRENPPQATLVAGGEAICPGIKLVSSYCPCSSPELISPSQASSLGLSGW